MDIPVNEKIDLEKLGSSAEKAVEKPVTASLEKEPAGPDSFQEKARDKELKKIAEKKWEGAKPGATQIRPPVLAIEQERARLIDQILSEGLHDIFLQLDPAKQQEFKKAGEETVVKINSLLKKARVKVDQIISLIRRWLKIIPGVNRFFLEQEAKIKADRIMRLKS